MEPGQTSDSSQRVTVDLPRRYKEEMPGRALEAVLPTGCGAHRFYDQRYARLPRHQVVSMGWLANMGHRPPQQHQPSRSDRLFQ